MAEANTHVEVLFCADLGESDGGIDLDAISDRLKKSTPGIRIKVVPDLCKTADQALETIVQGDVQRLVLGLCSRIPALHEFQAWVRKAGLDPYSFELVDLQRWVVDNGSSQNIEDAILLLAAAIERQKVFEGSDPEQLKMKILYEDRKLSRRSLVSLPPWAYEAVPTVKIENCLGHERCGLCVDACPVDAIEKVSGDLTINKLECKTCGICQATCPAGAFKFPGSSLNQYEEEMSILLSEENRSLVIACRRAGEALECKNGSSPLPAGWLPIEVPCMGAVTPGWVLQALANGASSIALLSCEEYCQTDQMSIVEQRVDYLQKLLEILGIEEPNERIKTVPAEAEKLAGSLDGIPALEPTGNRKSSDDLALIEPVSTAEAIVRLVDKNGASKDLSLIHKVSPMGLVTINKNTCTTCGSCASFCPTGALSIDDKGEMMMLTYDTVSCVNCGRCVPVCPEGENDTISVEGSTDLVAITKGRVTVKEEELARCKKCGEPIAPSSLLGKIESLLKDEEGTDNLVKTLTELCGDCRASVS